MKIKTVLFLTITIMVLIGCRTSPVYNVSDAPVVVASNKRYTLTDMRNAIYRAGIPLGWQMKEVKPGHIIATLNIRSHMAQTDINYNPNTYSITYRDSSDLNYDGDEIHSNYNGWIQNLDNAIRTQLSML